jgi:5-methylcytosine-specific restriction endonuclease McrA
MESVAKVSYGSKWGRVRVNSNSNQTKVAKSPEEVVKEIKKGMEKPPGEDYREKAFALFGLVCARCGREFDESNRQLLTVHHKDGNHHYNPENGSNWENLCVYCHEDAHSREILGDYLGGTPSGKEVSLVYDDNKTKNPASSGLGALGEKLKKALEEKKRL